MSNTELIRIRAKWEHDGYHPWKDDAFKALEIAEDMEAERDAALAVIERVRSATAALDRRVEDSEDISYFWGEAFDTISEIDAAINAKATS